MVNSSREVVGAVLKYMGASYNSKDLDFQVAGGRNAVQQNLELLTRQVVSANILSPFFLLSVSLYAGYLSAELSNGQEISLVAHKCSVTL